MDPLTSVFSIEPPQKQDVRNRETRCWSCANDKKACVIEIHAENQLDCLRCRKLKRNCSNEASQQSKKRNLSRLKCAECRRRKQKCIFQSGPWPIKCEQCETHNFECSEPREPGSSTAALPPTIYPMISPTKRQRETVQGPPLDLPPTKILRTSYTLRRSPYWDSTAVESQWKRQKQRSAAQGSSPVPPCTTVLHTSHPLHPQISPCDEASDTTIGAELLLGLNEPQPSPPQLLQQMDIDSLMPSALASPNEDVSRDVDPAAKGSDYVTSCLGFNFTPGTNARPTCFRIANIPSTWSKSDLLGVFQTVDPFLNDHKYCLSLYPACYHLSQTALLSLDVCTTYFQSLKPDESSYLRTSDGTVLVVDSHFYHLTPLNTPDPRSEIDVIAVTSLEGHAFGSWRSPETHLMWLQDFLPKDVKNVRIMAYGCNRNLRYEEGDTGLSINIRNFIEQLENSRCLAEDRPIIFAAHGLDCLFVLQTLLQVKRSHLHKSILDSTHGLFFFALPHQILRTEKLDEILDVDSNGQGDNSITQLKKSLEFLGYDWKGLQYIWRELKQKVVVFSETWKTPSARKFASSDLARDEQESQTIRTFAEQQHLPFENWILDNKDSVQFSSPIDPTYLTVVKYMREYIARSSARKILRSTLEGIGPDQFLQVLSPVDQEKYQSGLPKLDRDDPKFCWVFENMDFEQWCLANPQVLWLTGPPECGTHEVASHIVDLARSQDSETQPIVFYFFCSTVTGTKSIMAAFIHALLQQLISYSSPLKKISVITAFLCTLLDTVICRDSDADADLWRLIKNPDCSPELKIRKILDVSSVNGHWHANAIKQILHIEQEQGLTIIIDGLDEAKDQKTGFIKEICGFITHLKQQTCKFKVLLTSQPQIEIKALLEGLSCIEYDIERKECLNSLRFDNTRYREIPDAHEATLEWLWTHEKYRKWSESDSSTLLYIEGKPGSGKSTLAKYFKDNLLRREPKANVASFFYSRRDGDRHASHYSMLRSLLYDILSQCESFFPLLQQDYRQYQDLRPERGGWPCFSLKKALLSLGNHRRVERLYLIIDALDESDSKDRRDIVQLLLKLCSTKSVKIFVTSRPVVELSSYFTGSHHVIRMQDENEPDIRHFVDSFIPGIGFSESALSQVRKYILENAQGVFLWVRLVKDNLYSYTEVGCTMSEIFNFLRSLPRELEGLYEPIVQDLERNDKDVADTRKMLQFVLFARRPLTVSELQHALAIPNDPDAKFKHSIESFEDNQIVGIEKRIIHCGGNLIEIKGHGGITSVQLMHQTVREFFLRPGVSTAAPRLSMSENDAHLRIAIACIRYLTLCSGQAATHGAESQHVDAWEPESFKAYVRYLHQRPLINYALNHLEDHFRKCTDATNLSDIISQLAGELTPGSAPYYLLESWITPYLNKSPSREMAGAAQDFRNKILLAAARTGYYRVAEALLIAGAQINIQDSDDGSTALHLAAKQGHEATVRLLLEKGANTKVKDHDGKTAPHRGATVQLLLDHGANTETRDSDDGSTTPHQVTEQRRKSMIRLPPSDEAKFNDGIPALPRGAKRWRTDTVRVVDKSH